MNKLVTVIPKSRHAKNRFANLMGNNGVCIVEQRSDKEVFLRARNGESWFWVALDNDPNWVLQ